MNELELYHHGILGQKWGIRRFQNKDGSLTPAGKKRLAELQNPDGSLTDKGSEQLAKYYNQYNNSYTKKGEKLSNNDKLIVEDIVRKYEDYKITELKKKEEYEAEIEKRCNEIRKELDNNIQNDDIIEGRYRDYRNNEKFRNKWNDDAKLGLKALEEIRGDVRSDDQGDIEWFLFEDQTIGMPTVASLINRGKTSDEVKKLINNSEFYYDITNDYYDLETATDIFAWEMAEGNFGGTLSNFADKCYEIKNRQNNK